MYNEHAEFQEEKEVHSYHQIMSEKRYKILEEIAPRYGVTVTLLQKAGEKYRHSYRGLDAKEEVQTRDTVNEGDVYIKILSPNANLSALMDEVELQEKAV